MEDGLAGPGGARGELGAYLDGKRVKALQSHVDVDGDGAAWRGHQEGLLVCCGR